MRPAWQRGGVLLAGVGEQALSKTARTGSECLLQVGSARAQGCEHTALWRLGWELGSAGARAHWRSPEQGCPLLGLLDRAGTPPA